MILEKIPFMCRKCFRKYDEHIKVHMEIMEAMRNVTEECSVAKRSSSTPNDSLVIYSTWNL